MALVVKDRVQETSTTTGTGTLTLSGAVTGFQTFSSAIGNGNTTYYAITLNGEWEVGIGTVGAGTLSRDTVLESSNSGSLVNFGSGTKQVFCTYPAEKSVDIDTAQTLTNKTISADNNTISGIAASSFVLSNASGNIDGSASQKAIPSGDVVGTTDSQTLTNKTISGASNTISNIGNSSLTNSSITINGSATALGGSINVGTVTSVSGTSPVASSGGNTPAISLSSGYGDTQNPYASKTANFFLAAPNGTAGVPTFRAIVAADVPTLNQNTTGTASNVTGTVAVANGGTGATTAPNARTNLGATTVGSNLFTLTNPSAITFPRINADNTVSALDAATFRSAIGAGTGNGTVTSVSGTGSYGGLTLSGTVTSSGNITLGGTPTGTWPISVSGNAATATTATNQSGGTVSATTGSFSGQLSVPQSASVGANGINLNAAGNGFLRGTANDNASSTQANVQLMSWWGIGFSPSITGQSVPQGENAVWIDVRNGTLQARGTITAPTFSGNLSGNATTASNGGVTSVSAGTGISVSSTTGAITVTNTSPNQLTTTTGSAPYYGLRSWINFDGTTNTIRSSANVTSITDFGTGDFGINYSTALADANVSAAGMGNQDNSNVYVIMYSSSSTTQLRIRVARSGLNYADSSNTFVLIAR